MAKDPAFLFYYQDFIVGTSFMSNAEVGAYIRILSHLADKKALHEKHMIKICDSSDIWESIKIKFTKDNDGNYYNIRLREESEKRAKYSESRRNNRESKKTTEDITNTSKTYVKHMGNEDINEDEDESLIDVKEVPHKEIEESIKQTWNYFAESYRLPKLKVLTKSRLAKLRIRLKESFDIIEILKEAEKSDFLKGNNKNGWKLTFDWLIENEKNYLKILEGNYKNGTSERNNQDAKHRAIAESIANDPDLK